MGKRHCCCCGKEFEFSYLFGKREGFELSDPGGQSNNSFICKACAAELGYKNTFSIGIKSTKYILMKYAKLHPEKAEAMQADIEKAQSWTKFILSTGKQAAGEENKDTEEAEKLDYSNYTDEQLQAEINTFIVPDPGMILQEGELCCFSVPCNSVKFKNVVVGASRTSNYFGMGSKGIYAGHGLSYKANDRQNVSEKYPGHFHMTNKRMVCSAVKLSFEIPLTKITAMTSYSDGLAVMSGGREYIVEFEGIRKFMRLLAINNEIERRKASKNQTAPAVESVIPNAVTDVNIPKLLREYKALYDDGIITEEEFNNKKKQLLAVEK